MDLRILLVAEKGQADRVRPLIWQGLSDWTGKGSPLRADLVHAGTLRDACVHVQAVPFDVVLMGVGAIESPGVGALARLREVEPDVPVVVFMSSEEGSAHVAPTAGVQRAPGIDAWHRAGAVVCLTSEHSGPAQLAAALVQASRGAWTKGGDVAEAIREH